MFARSEDYYFSFFNFNVTAVLCWRNWRDGLWNCRDIWGEVENSNSTACHCNLLNSWLAFDRKLAGVFSIRCRDGLPYSSDFCPCLSMYHLDRSPLSQSIVEILQQHEVLLKFLDCIKHPIGFKYAVRLFIIFSLLECKMSDISQQLWRKLKRFCLSQETLSERLRKRFPSKSGKIPLKIEANFGCRPFRGEEREMEESLLWRSIRRERMRDFDY